MAARVRSPSVTVRCFWFCVRRPGPFRDAPGGRLATGTPTAGRVPPSSRTPTGARFPRRISL
eukprot:9741535-Lingulodinium_polyedra.AAC.1